MKNKQTEKRTYLDRKTERAEGPKEKEKRKHQKQNKTNGATKRKKELTLTGESKSRRT